MHGKTLFLQIFYASLACGAKVTINFNNGGRERDSLSGRDWHGDSPVTRYGLKTRKNEIPL